MKVSGLRRRAMRSVNGDWLMPVRCRDVLLVLTVRAGLAKATIHQLARGQYYGPGGPRNKFVCSHQAATGDQPDGDAEGDQHPPFPVESKTPAQIACRDQDG